MATCPKCGEFCGTPYSNYGTPSTNTKTVIITGKNKSTAIILAIFLGGLGIHKFYIGNNILGVLYLLFCWTFIPVILSLLDAIILMVMSDDSFNAKYNQ